MSDSLQILYHDDHYVAVDKPAGLLVHRSWIAAEAQEFLLQQVRDRIKKRVYPVHRLDRPTSGVVVFGLSSEASRRLCAAFAAHQVEKRYLALVRGWPEEQGLIDYPLQEEEHKDAAEARTAWRRLATVELDVAVGRYPKARYALIEARPETGRMHQIRKHFKHIFHPLVGDTTYGEGRHNRLFRDRYDITRLMLHAKRLCFTQPFTGEALPIEAPLPAEFERLFQVFGWGEG